jgi:predicted esterase
LLNLIPKAALERIQAGGAIAFGVAQFAPGSIAASSTRLLASSTDLDERVDSVQRVGLLNDRSVKFHSVATELRKPITSLAEIGSRIEELDASSGQVLVETYVAPNGSRTLLVYLPGTQSFSPIAGKNPFDLVTDTALLTEPENSELLKAVSAALNQSGAKGSNVIFAGYSLGGIAAAALAIQSGQAVSGVVTIGAPVGQFQLPENVPVLSIQHSNDPIPAASGETNPLTKNWATVSRSAELPFGTPAMEAHDLDRYRETLAMVDAETMPGVSRVRELILNQVLGSRLLKAEAFEFRR